MVTVLAAFADEKLSVLKVGSETYSNVTVIKVSPTDVYFVSDKGLANAKLKDLSLAMQKHFHYDPAKAAALQTVQAGNAGNRIQAVDISHATSIAEVKSEMDNAMTRVREIVNQPVTSLRRTPDMEVATYSPGWFHPGAEKPEFDTVDVRATQTFPYDPHPYVTSDLNPDVVFIGPELEFNAMTKYFYTDRTVPKKKLTEEEMLEINQLYRIIGKCEQRLDELQNPVFPMGITRLWAGSNKLMAVAAGLLLLVAVLVFLIKRRSEA